MHTVVEKVRRALHASVDSTPERVGAFFKKVPGAYAAQEQFLGVRVGALRQLAKTFCTLELSAIAVLLQSPFNEERLLALLILVHQYQRGNEGHKEAIYRFYLDHLSAVNNWNLVDSSAHHIVGAHLWTKERYILSELIESTCLWRRRVALLATLYFIRQGEMRWTLLLAERVLADGEDLIHKASGWMLREVGKRVPQDLTQFLDRYAAVMPRTMLRYALERMPQGMRKSYLAQKASTDECH